MFTSCDDFNINTIYFGEPTQVIDVPPKPKSHNDKIINIYNKNCKDTVDCVRLIGCEMESKFGLLTTESLPREHEYDNTFESEYHIGNDNYETNQCIKAEFDIRKPSNVKFINIINELYDTCVKTIQNNKTKIGIYHFTKEQLSHPIHVHDGTEEDRNIILGIKPFIYFKVSHEFYNNIIYNDKNSDCITCLDIDSLKYKKLIFIPIIHMRCIYITYRCILKMEIIGMEILSIQPINTICKQLKLQGDYISYLELQNNCSQLSPNLYCMNLKRIDQEYDVLPHYYYSSKIRYNYGSSEHKVCGTEPATVLLDNFELEGCEMISENGIIIQDDKAYITVNTKDITDLGFIKVINGIYNEIYQYATTLKFLNLDKLKHCYNVMINGEKLKCKIHDRFTYPFEFDDNFHIISITFPLFDYYYHGKSLFVDKNNNIIQWNMLNKQIKFIPLLHIDELYIKNNHCKINIIIKSAIITEY